MKQQKREARRAGEEAGTPADEPALRVRRKHDWDTSRRYSVAEKLALVDEFVKGGETFDAFCARHRVSTASLCKWRRALRASGEAGLAPKSNRRNLGGHRGPARSPEQRRQAVEAFAKSGMRQDEFARVWGLSVHTLRNWLTRYKDAGPKGLEPRPRGRPKGSGGFVRSVWQLSQQALSGMLAGLLKQPRTRCRKEMSMALSEDDPRVLKKKIAALEEKNKRLEELLRLVRELPRPGSNLPPGSSTIPAAKKRARRARKQADAGGGELLGESPAPAR